MHLVYIAGPFRGATAWEVAENVRAAERVGLEVARAGFMPIIPHANSAHFHGEGDDAFWLEGTLELLRRCDAVVLTPDWVRSSGARAEFAEARRLRLPVYACVADMVKARDALCPASPPASLKERRERGMPCAVTVVDRTRDCA